MILLALPLLLFWALLSGVLFLAGLASLLLAYQSLPQILVEGVSYNAISLCVFQNSVKVFAGQTDYIILALRLLPILLLLLTLLAFVLVGNTARLLPKRSDRLDTIQTVVALNILFAFFLLMLAVALPPQIRIWVSPLQAPDAIGAIIPDCAVYGNPAENAQLILQITQISQYVFLVVGLTLLFFAALLWRYRPDQEQLSRFYPSQAEQCNYCHLSPENRLDGGLGCVLCHIALRISPLESAEEPVLKFRVQHHGGFVIHKPSLRFDSSRNFPIESIQSEQGAIWTRNREDEMLWQSASDLQVDTITVTYRRGGGRGLVRVAIRPDDSQTWSQWHVLRT